MRYLMLDLDTLRPDHLGCYGYHRNTSPNIDELASECLLFENYHCSDAPCLPSRAALTTGMFGIHNGAVNHGDSTADLRLYGNGRDFKDQILFNNLFYQFRHAGIHTATVSTFAERHSSYWFNAGFNEVINCGKYGDERAEEVTPLVLKWLEDMMLTSRYKTDPMWTVIREGGPFHAKGNLPMYCARLERTGRAEGAALLREKHPQEFRN